MVDFCVVFLCYFYGILLCLVALENVSIVGAHHLPLSFAFHAPRFLILLFSYDFVVCYVLVICYVYVVYYLLKCLFDFLIVRVSLSFPFEIQYKNYILSPDFHFEEATFFVKINIRGYNTNLS